MGDGAEKRKSAWKPLPPSYFFGALLSELLVHVLLPVHQIVVFPWRLIGIAPILLGIALNLLADRALKLHETTVKPFEESTALVTNGVFGHTRNPMYLGMILMLMGAALLLGSATPFIVVVFLVALLDHVFIRPEERQLEQAFGERFQQYRARVRKWL